MHRCSVFKNSCINVPVDPISRMPKTAYERNGNNTAEQCSIESSTSCSITGADVDAEKLKDFYKSIPDYNDINHLSETEFYSTLKSLREKKKLMLGIAVEHIDDCITDKIYAKSDRDICPSTNLRRYNETALSDIVDNEKIKHISRNNVTKHPRRGVRKLDNTVIEKVGEKCEKSDQMVTTKKNTLLVKGNPKLSRPRRNHSACSISWHDDKVENKNTEIDEKFEQYFEGNRQLNDDNLYKTQSMPSSPLRTRTIGSSLRRRRRSITIPKPFKMTERDEENRIVNELRSLQKSLSEDMLHQKREKKRFRVKPVPIESRIPLYDKILEDQAMRRAITKINSEAELRAQMKPFSFTKKEETGVGGMCARTANILPKCKKKKRFRARPVPKNLFSNYFYEKNKEDTFFRAMNRRIRSEEMLRNSSLPVTALCDRSRLSTPAAHSDLPIDPSPAVPSVSSSDKNRSTSPMKDKRKTKHYKEDFITTTPRPFRFNTAERASKKISEISKKIYQNSKSSCSGDDSLGKNNTIFDKTEAYTALDLKGIAAGRSNLAALLRAEAVRRKFELEAAKHLADQRKRAETKNRDRVLRANPAWHLVKNNHEQDIAMRLQTRRDEERMRREEFLHEMELMYGRVQQQPMLFERYYAPRSGAATVDSIQLSPRKSPSKKRATRKSKSYHPNSSISSEFCGDLLKYLDKYENAKRKNRSQLYEDEEAIDSLERE